MNLPDDLISPGAVARLLGVTPSSVYRWIYAKKLTAYRIGGKRRVSQADALAFVQRTGPQDAVKKVDGVPRMGHEAAMALLRARGIIKS